MQQGPGMLDTEAAGGIVGDLPSVVGCEAPAEDLEVPMTQCAADSSQGLPATRGVEISTVSTCARSRSNSSTIFNICRTIARPDPREFATCLEKMSRRHTTPSRPAGPRRVLRTSTSSYS